ncbi:MAG: hypothetical protein KIS78_08325 [Labilithrix sp.]|nr:hypothetical protein [Labilithrix sp.]
MNKQDISKPLRLAAGAIFVVWGLAACSGDDDSGGGSSSGGSSSGGSSSGGSSSGGGSCSGDITQCSMGSLSEEQSGDVCALILTSIDTPAGTKFECKEGSNEGLFIGVSSREECVQQRPPASCTLTVGTLIECYKAAKNDACAAFDGACKPLLDPSNGCVP